MTPTPLHFESRDMLNSALLGPDGVVEFTTDTQIDLYAHRRTFVSSRSGARAAIDWTAKTFSIEGKQRPWTLLKKNVGGPFTSKLRMWHWEETRYTIRYARDQEGEMCYTVRPSRDDGKWEKGPGGTRADVARLSPIVVHFFKPPENAIVYLAPDLEEREGMFLLLVLITSETKRCESIND
ncbi:hypothetical protein B0H19DRAFT_1271267 [Mycena capillaripes]|nr:hypothetical protein B0H19DRAFT_1271267 [Mycena capillaripes]